MVADKRNAVVVPKDEVLSLKDRYALFDKRASDSRAILLGIVAGMVAITIQLVNSLYEDRSLAVILYFGLMIALAWAAVRKIAPEVEFAAKEADKIRRQFTNRHDIPLVDELIAPQKPSWLRTYFGFPKLHPDDYRKSIAEDHSDPSKSIKVE